MNKLYLVIEDYFKQVKIIGLFKNIENAKYYQQNYSSDCYILPIITDFEVIQESEAK